MQHLLAITLFFMLLAIIGSCKKEKEATGCLNNATTVRQILNKQAVIKLNATINPVWIIEQGTIDTKLIPCNFPMEFYEDGLQVIISGEVKLTPQVGPGPCCTENFVITKITR